MSQLVIMAAGAGSRFGGPKQLEPIGPGGERLFDYAVFDAVRAGFTRVVFVVRDELAAAFDPVAAAIRSGLGVDTCVVVQQLDDLPGGRRPGTRVRPWGTGHAVLAARDLVDAPFAVINADDFYGRKAYERAAAATGGAGAAGVTTVVAMRLADTLSPHGPVTRAVCALDGLRVVRLDEVRDTHREPAGVVGTAGGERRQLSGDELVSMNFWVFPTGLLQRLLYDFESFLDARAEDDDAEFLLPEAVSAIARRGETHVEAVPVPGPWYGLTHASDRAGVAAGLRALADRGDYPIPLW
jgi:hypothetical protein